MRQRDLVLLPTERHVDDARVAGELAQTYRSFIQAAFDGAPHAALLAGEAVTRLATARALSNVVPSRRRPGSHAAAPVAAAFDRTIAQLRRAGALPHHLRATGTPRGAMLAEVLEYVDELYEAAHCIDERGVGRYIAEHPDAISLVARGAIEIRGRLGFDQSDFAWMTALEAYTGGRMGVTLALPAGRVLAHEDPFERLEARLQTRIGDPNFAPLFVHDEISAQSTPQIVQASDPGSEARAVAWHIARELDAGTRPERIAVVLARDDDAFLEPLRAAFFDAALPFTERASMPASATGAAAAALGFLRLAAGPVTRTGLIDLLSNPAVDGRRWVGGPDELEARRELARLARALRAVPLTADASGSGFVRALAATKRADDAVLRMTLERVVRDFDHVRRDPTRTSVLSRFDDVVRGLGLAGPSLAALRGAVRYDVGARAMAGLGSGFAAARSVLEASTRAHLASVMLGIASDRVDVATVAAELEAAISLRPEEGADSNISGAIAWLSPTDAAGLSLDAVVLAGASDAHERAAVARGVTLLDEPTRERLPPFLRPPQPMEGASIAHAEIAWVVAAAKRAVVTHACLEPSGREASPSQIVRALLRGGCPQEPAPASRVAASSHVVGVRAARIRDLASGKAKPTEEVAAIVAVERAREQFFLGPTTAPSKHDGDASASSDHLVSLLGGTAALPLSVTALEAAAQCRFLALVRTGLRVVREADVDEVGDRREYGTLVHDALDKAFVAMRDLDPNADTAQRKAVALASSNAALSTQQHAGALRRFAIRRVKRTVEAVVDEYLGSPSDFRFHAAEQAFGEASEGSWPALIVAHDGHELVLRGRIDRLDYAPERRALRAVDYKTGASVSARKDWGVVAFQPVFYAQVGARELSAAAMSAAYLSARDKAVWKPAEKSQLLEQGEVKQAAVRALAIVRGLHGGDFAPRPADASFCAACEARDVCRRPPFAASTPSESE